MYDFSCEGITPNRRRHLDERSSSSSGLSLDRSDPESSIYPRRSNLNIINDSTVNPHCDCMDRTTRRRSSRVTENSEGSGPKRRRRNTRREGSTRPSRHPAPTRSSTSLASTSTLLATTSILFAATGTSVRGAPQPTEPRVRSNSNLSPRQLEKSRAIELDSASLPTISPFAAAADPTLASPPPTIDQASLTRRNSPTPPPDQKTKRKVLPKYEYTDGSWIVDTGWTLRGSIPSLQPLHTRHRATALADNAISTSLQTRSKTRTPVTSSLSTSTPTTTTATTTTGRSPPAYVQHAYASASEVPIPRGWQTRPRETDFYAVPVIIAMSVLVAIIVVGAILGSVCWRKKKRRRRDPEKDVQEKGWRGIVQKVRGGGGRGHKSGKEKKRKRKVKKTVEGSVVPAERDVVEASRDEDAQSLRESIGSAGSGNRTPRIVRTTGFAAVSDRSRPRWRNRRRRNADDGDASGDDETAALTRTDTRSTTSSTGPRDALTARLTARMHGSSPNRDRSGPSTVFSRLPERNRSSSSLSGSNDPFPRTSTQDSHLTRSPSRSSLYGAPLPVPSDPPTILFTPADDPALSPRPPGSPAFEPLSIMRVQSRTTPLPSPALPHLEPNDPLLPAPAIPTSTPSSFNALLSHDADLGMLLMPGPPAYRPASSTVQTTRRYGAGDSPNVFAPATPSTMTSRIASVGRRRRGARASQTVEDEEAGQGGEWHWPGEKGRMHESGAEEGAAAGPSTSTSFSPFAVSNEEEEQEEHHEEEPPVDRSLYQAHLATDDKAVLNRLRNRGQDETDDQELGSSSRLELPTASAPPVVEEEELDEDGFERFEPEHAQERFTTSEKAKLRAPPSPLQRPVSSNLPAPPTRGDFSYSYLSRPDPAPASSTIPSTSKSALAAEYAALQPREEEEELDLPVYLPQEQRNEVLGMASAPPALDDDDEEDEDEEGITHATI